MNWFHKTINNIISNYIPHETITCDDRDPPLINNFELLQSKLNSLIKKCEFNYYARLSQKLSDSITSPKSYWSILKTFLKNKKIHYIPPLLHHDKFITNFKEKAEIFNIFFAKKCFLININSDLPSIL